MWGRHVASAMISAHSEPPRWARQLVGGEHQGEWSTVAPQIAVRTVACRDFAVVSARIDGAVRMSALQLQQATVTAYDSIATRLAGIPARHAVRIWNFIPHILAPLGDLPHRYMVFNAGRFAVYTKWCRSVDDLRRSVATASGVGHFGEDLLVHCLGAGRQGRPLENPRQIPSYGYSARYGPMPPCFARAMRLRLPGGRESLLVGGTASVVGEDTIHPADLAAQARETFVNLAAIVGCAEGAEPQACTNGHCDELLDRFHKLRVYLVRPSDAGRIRDLVEQRFPSLDELEYVHAHLCRPDLLLEIEGVADVGCPDRTGAANGRRSATEPARP